MFKQMKIGTRLSLAFACLLLGLGASIWIGTSRLGAVNDINQQLLKREMAKVDEANEVKDLIQDNARDSLQLLLTLDQDARSRMQVRIMADFDDIIRRLVRLEHILWRPEGIVKMARVKETHTRYVAAFSQAFALIKEGQREPGLRILREQLMPGPDGDDGCDEVIRAIRDLTRFYIHAVQGDLALSQHYYQTGRALLVLIGIAMGLLGGSLAVGVTRSITLPLSRAVAAADRIAAGDLSVKTEVDSQDEIGQLLSSMNIMVEQLAGFNAVLEKRVEDRTVALRLSEELNRTILDCLPGGLMHVKLDGSFERVNATARRIAELPPEGPLPSLLPSPPPTSWVTFLAEDGSPIATEQSPLLTCMRTGAAQPERVLGLRRRDGAITWTLTTAVPVRLPLGAAHTGVVVSMVDITDRRNTEDELRRAREAALEASRLKSQFLANMSHEIRTPMNGVLGMTALALSTELTDEQRGYLQTVQSSGEGLLLIINDILDISKIEAHKMELEHVPLSLPELLTATLHPLMYRAVDKGLRLSGHIDDVVPKCILGDPVRLRQILTNLVGNAIKFTAAGEVRVELTQQGSGVLLVKVTDTGLGIPKERQASVFDAFTQADGTTTRQFGGTGLGLTISRELVALMGGQLTVRSEVGVGSTFSFSIPVQAAPRQRTKPPVRVAELALQDRGPLRVLLVEDNAVNTKVALRMLQKLGHQAVHAENGALALALLETEQFDVVLMDVQMPQMDGLEATRRLRERERGLFHTPVIALTANAMKGDDRACLEAGMDSYLTKPVRMEALQAALSHIHVCANPDRRLQHFVT